MSLLQNHLGTGFRRNSSNWITLCQIWTHIRVHIMQDMLRVWKTNKEKYYYLFQLQLRFNPSPSWWRRICRRWRFESFDLMQSENCTEDELEWTDSGSDNENWLHLRTLGSSRILKSNIYTAPFDSVFYLLRKIIISSRGDIYFLNINLWG